MERRSNGIPLPQEFGEGVLVGEASYRESRAKIEQAQMLLDSWNEANERGRQRYELMQRELARKVQEGEEAKRLLARLHDTADHGPLAIMAPPKLHTQPHVSPSAARIEEVPAWNNHSNAPNNTNVGNTNVNPSYVPNQITYGASGSSRDTQFRYHRPEVSGQLPYGQLAHQHQQRSYPAQQYTATPLATGSWQNGIPGTATSSTYQPGSGTARSTYAHPSISATMEQDIAAKEMLAQLERQRVAREAAAPGYRPKPVVVEPTPASTNVNIGGDVRHPGSGRQSQRQEPALQITAASYRHERNNIVDPIPLAVPEVASNLYPTAVSNAQPPQTIEIPSNPVPPPPPVQQHSTQAQITSPVQNPPIATKPQTNPTPGSIIQNLSTSVPPPSSSGSHNVPPGSTAIPTNKKTLPIILKTQDDIRQFENKITVWAQSAPPNSYYDIPYTLCRIYKDKSAAVFILFRDDQAKWNTVTTLAKLQTWKGSLEIPPPAVVQAPQPVQAVVEQPPKPVQVTVIREARHANKKHLARDILRALGHATISLKRPRDETNNEPEAKRRALGDSDPNVSAGSDAPRQISLAAAPKSPGKPKEDHIMQDVSRTDPHPSVPTTLDPVQPIQPIQIETASNSLPQDTPTPVSQTSANQHTPLPQVPTAGPPPMVVPITLLPNAPQPAVGHTSLVTDLSAQPGSSKPSDQTSRSTDSVVMNSPPSSVSKPSPLPQTAVSNADPSSALAGPSKIPSQQRTTNLTTTPPAPRSATSAQSIPPLSPPVQSDSSSRRDGNSEPHNPSSLHVSPEVTPPVSSSPSLRGASVGPPKTPLFLPGSSASSPSRDPDTEDEAGPSIWVRRGSRTTSSSTSSHRSTPEVYVLVPPLPEYVKRHKALLRGHKRSTPGSRAAPLAVEQIFRGVVCNDSAEEEAVRVVCTRLRERRCKWAGCDVVMNSLGNLEHHLLQHGEANVAKSNYVQCQWQQCGRNIPYPQMSDHLRTHALSPLPCAYQGCDQSFRTPRQLLKHNQSVHGNDALMPSWLPSNYKPKSSPPMAPKSLPSWMVEARQVFQPIVSRERHAVLGPWVLRNISGPVGSGTRRYNAANPLPASQQSRESEEPQQPVYDDYEFLTNSSTTHSSAPSKASRNRRYEYLDSRTVSQYVNDGLVLWQNPEEDVDSTRGTLASMGEDELNLIAGSEIKTEANDSGSLHAPAENPMKQVLPPHHKSSDGLERPVLNEINQEAARQLDDAPLDIGRPTGNADVDEGAVEAMLVVS